MHALVHDRLVAPLDAGDHTDGRIGDTVLRIPVVESTNAMLIELGRGGATDGTVLIAADQVGGRGKGERSWFSRRGESLCVSVLLRRSPRRDFGQLTLVAAVAIHDAVARLGIETSIKWPNDILLGDRKVCGILAEAAASPEGEIEFVVLGFGLNVSIAADDFPPALRDIAGSLQQATHRPLGCDSVLDPCLSALSDWIAVWEEHGFAPVAEAWRRHSSTLGRRVVVADEREQRSGTAVRLAADGALVLRDDAGREHHIHSGDICNGRAPVGRPGPGE